MAVTETRMITSKNLWKKHLEPLSLFVRNAKTLIPERTIKYE